MHTNRRTLQVLLKSVLFSEGLAEGSGDSFMVAEPGIEPGTRGFSIRCSTN